MKVLLLALLLSRGAVVPADTYWGRGHHVFAVSFTQPTPWAVRTAIVRHMNRWGDFGAVHYWDCTPAVSPVCRISLNTGEGNWSYVGTDNLGKWGPTMWLDDMTSVAAVERGRGGIWHETGHHLGFADELDRPDLRQRVLPSYAYWSWLDPPLDMRRCFPARPADPDSVMCWYVPPSADRLGKGFGGAWPDLSAEDKRYVSVIYPK